MGIYSTGIWEGPLTRYGASRFRLTKFFSEEVAAVTAKAWARHLSVAKVDRADWDSAQVWIVGVHDA